MADEIRLLTVPTRSPIPLDLSWKDWAKLAARAYLEGVSLDIYMEKILTEYVEKEERDKK